MKCSISKVWLVIIICDNTVLLAESQKGINALQQC